MSKKKLSKSVIERVDSTGQFLLSLLIICMLAVLVVVDPENSILSGLRVFLGVLCVVLIPGRRITKAAFLHKKIDIIERLAIAVALSVSVVPLLVFYLNIAGIPITQYLVLGVITIVVIVSYALFEYR